MSSTLILSVLGLLLVIVSLVLRWGTRVPRGVAFIVLALGAAMLITSIVLQVTR